MRDNPATRHESGFTLLEILVAITVLALLIVGLNQGVRSGFAFWSMQTRRSGETAELDTTARLLRGLFTDVPVQATGGSAAGAAPVAIGFEGGADRLALVGDLPTGFGESRRADIRLSLRDGRVVLAWTPHRHEQTAGASPQPAEIELMRGVQALEFAYWGDPTGAGRAAWIAQWDGPALPQLIRVRLRFAKGDGRRWPDLVAAPQLWGGAS